MVDVKNKFVFCRNQNKKNFALWLCFILGAKNASTTHKLFHLHTIKILIKNRTE